MSEQTRFSEPEDDGWEWAIVEIFGHRRHAGRTREEERFGAKMLRIDIPIVEWSIDRDEDGSSRAIITGWKTHFYGGASLFSFSLTDEATAIRANAPHQAPARLTYSGLDDASEDAGFDA